MNPPENRSSVEPPILSFGQRFFLVWAWLFRSLFDGRFAAQLRSTQLEFDKAQGRAARELAEAPARPSLPSSAAERMAPEPKAAAEHAAATAAIDEARRTAVFGLLGLLQREGRFVDFVEQDISAFSDADIGAAARLVHDGCRKALAEHVPIRPIAEQPEGASIRVEAGYDPAIYKLTGQVSGTAPYSGVLRHKGWRATGIELPEPVAGFDNSVLMPAEVEV